MKKIKGFIKIAFCTLLFLVITATAFSQQVYKGIVKSPTGEPVVGSTITVKETNSAAVSDNNGIFSINAVQGNTLIISSLGYKTQQATVTGTYLNIVLDTTS